MGKRRNKTNRKSFETNRTQHVPAMSGVKENYEFNSASSNPRKNNSSVELPSSARDVPHFSYMCDTDDEDAYDFSRPYFDNSVKARHSQPVLRQEKSIVPRDVPHFSYMPETDEDAYDFSRPYFDNSVKARHSQPVLRQEKSKEKLFTSIDEYGSSKNSFSRIFKKWFPERRKTLIELESLFEEVLSAQQKYNEAQANVKGFSAEMKTAVIRSETEAGHFFASFASFVSDAVSGIASFAQAFKVDAYQTKLQEIMDHDAEITKELYETRSRCVARYQGIEEVMRKFHYDTFDSTVGKISSTLEVNKYWESMKSAYKNDDMETLLNTVGKFFDNACQSEKLDKIGNALDRYVSDNPAALEACQSTGKAVYGAVNTWAPEENRRGVRGKINCAANGYLMLKDREEADRFRSAANDDCQGSKLVRQIRDAKDSLESELEEMSDIYRDLFKNDRSRVVYDFE